MAPESIPPYSHEDFPMNKLTKPVKDTFDKLFGRLNKVEDQKSVSKITSILHFEFAHFSSWFIL